MVKLFKIDRLKRQVEQHQPFSPQVEQVINDMQLLQCIYRSNALDQSSLNYAETNLFLFSKIRASHRSEAEHLAVVNHVNAYRYLYDRLSSKDLSLDFKFIEDLNRILCAGFASGSEAVLQDGFAQKFAFFATWYIDKRKQLHPVELAVRVHAEMCRLNPNKWTTQKIARICQNFVLMANGLPAVTINPDHAEFYLRSVQEACFGAVENLMLLVKSELIENLEFIMKVVSRKYFQDDKNKHSIYQIRKERLLTLDSLATLTGISPSKISRIENRQGDISESMLSKFAEALNVSVESLRETGS